MQAAASSTICPECGTRLEGGFSSALGCCMVCLLRVGFDEPEEPDDALLAAGADRLGNYRIERRNDGTPWELGRGAMGVTYRAVDTTLERAVALKLIDSEWVKRGAEARERFMREARTAAALRHPNVAAVHHFGIREENGQCFCAMELIEGETLEMRVRRTGPVDALTAIEIALQVSSALVAAEKQGLVHRDLKPGNLMLVGETAAANGSNAVGAEEIVVKVIDFGVAKALADKPDAMGLTHGGFVGTPAFASPEQFTNSPVDVRSDIYSLGATLWYLLTGHMPFPGRSVEEIRAGQQSKALPIKQLKAARVPRRVVSLIVSMLAAEPAARPGVRALTLRLQECRAQILDRWKIARRFALAAGLIGIAIAAFVLFARGQNRVTPQNAVFANVTEKTVAVLPFENLSEDKSNAYFAGGVRDEILTKLAQVRGLRVVSRSSTKKNESRPGNLADLGRQLGTDTFLEGSVQKLADDLAIHVQLIDAKTGAQVWAQSYQRASKDISEVEGEVAHQVANALKVKLAPGEAQRLRLAATNNPRAHDSYLRARAQSAYSDEKSHEEQIALLREAVAEDPQYAVAWAELAGAYVHIGDAYRAPREILTPARDAAEKAVAMDEQLAAGHMVLAGIALTYDWNFPLAKREFERAIALDPDSSDAHRLYGWYLARAERNFVAARQEMAKARTLDPFYTWPLWAESSVAIAQGDHESALRLAEHVIEINPQFLYDEDPIAHVYVAMERWPDAVKRYESIPPGRFNRPNFELAICYAHTGQTARARQILGELEGLAQQRYVDHTHLAGIHAALGDKDKAFAALEQALKDRSARVYAARFYPWLAPLRDDPRFIELENKVINSKLPLASEAPAPEKSVAVLPFENLSDETREAFPTDGIHEDILSSLSKIADLKLASSGAVLQYRNPKPAGRNLRAIATTLGVRNLVEGSVRRVGDRLLVKVQLTDALQDRLVWAERYDRSIADSITLQGELAMEIASALRARLSAEEQTAVAEKPTQNAEAYVLYLRGLEQQAGLATYKGLWSLRAQERLFGQAVALDPNFALAHARLSQALAYIYQDFEPSDANRQRARAEAETALRLQPNLGEGYFADALCLYWIEKDYEGAVRGFAKAALLLPNRAEVEAWGSFVRRRQGRWKEALEGFERGLERDPRNKAILSGYFATQYFLRDWAAARRAGERAVAAASEIPTLMRIERNYLSIWSAGDLVPLRESLAGVPPGVDLDGGVTLARWDLALMARDFAAAERAIMECDSETILANHGTPVPKGYFLGCVALARGDVEEANKIFDAARPLMEAEIKTAPLEAFRHAQLGALYAFMKRKEDALREGERAVELAPIEKDAIYGAQVLALLAAICAQTGEHDRAIELIQRLLVTPAAVLPAFEGSITLQELRLRRHWDPLRGDPRFQKILQGPEPRTIYR
jgi:TolB-like protein/Tfp pilus assembly protein PilF